MMMVERERENMKKKEKSQILYFDIFYVDLDRTSTGSSEELNRGFLLFSTYSLACLFALIISYEYVSCFILPLPTDSNHMIFLQAMNITQHHHRHYFIIIHAFFLLVRKNSLKP